MVWELYRNKLLLFFKLLIIPSAGKDVEDHYREEHKMVQTLWETVGSSF